MFNHQEKLKTENKHLELANIYENYLNVIYKSYEICKN
jgi:hypothetical protein